MVILVYLHSVYTCSTATAAVRLSLHVLNCKSTAVMAGAAAATVAGAWQTRVQVMPVPSSTQSTLTVLQLPRQLLRVGKADGPLLLLAWLLL
jgi:hypothetical protein